MIWNRRNERMYMRVYQSHMELTCGPFKSYSIFGNNYSPPFVLALELWIGRIRLLVNVTKTFVLKLCEVYEKIVIFGDIWYVMGFLEGAGQGQVILKQAIWQLLASPTKLLQIYVFFIGALWWVWWLKAVEVLIYVSIFLFMYIVLEWDMQLED